MHAFNSRQLFDSLKQVLRSRGITYRELASKVSFSESTIKNIFHDGNASIERVVELCEAVGITFPDLVNLANEEAASTFSFSLEQEQFFAEHPQYYYYFRDCFFEGKSPEVIAEHYHLSPASTLKYLLRLEKLGLLELPPENRVRFKVYGKLRWLQGGPWMRRRYPEYLDELTRLLLDHLDDARYYTSMVGHFKVSQETYDEFRREAEQLLERYTDLAFRESLIRREDRPRIPASFHFTIVPLDLFRHMTRIPDLD